MMHRARWRFVRRLPSNGRARDSSSTTRERGDAFEAELVRVMTSLGCDLNPTQASMDEGIDHQVRRSHSMSHFPVMVAFFLTRSTCVCACVCFQGNWMLPDSQLDVVTQCKNEQKAVGVEHLRAFNGVLRTFAPNVLGLFASASGYSIYAQR